MKKHFSFLIFIAAFFVGCNNNTEILESGKTAPVSFFTTIVENNMTRAAGTTWANDDEIGVFAISHGSGLDPGSIIDNNENLAFVTNGNGFFYAKGKNIYYPQAGNSMDIIAYYPYTGNLLSGYNYPVDVTRQEDFFYSNNLKGLSQTNSPGAALEFRRPLSKIVLNIAPKISGTSLEGLSISLTDVKTKAAFSLSEGKLTIDDQSAASFGIAATGSAVSKQASAIVLPTNGENEVAIRFQVGQTVYTWRVPHKLEAGKVYTYSVELDGLSTSIKPSSSYMEIPVYSSAPEAPNSAGALHLVGSTSWLNPHSEIPPGSIRNYSVLFDTQNRVPYWVAFPMHSMYMTSGNRTDEWAYDPIIPQNMQPTLFEGWKGNGIDRGHLLASADRNATRAINRTTFYFTNMAPQNSSMNGGTWASLETRVRYWSTQPGYDTLYVVTGCILPKAPEEIEYAYDNDNRQSVVPKYLYKALLRKKDSTGAYTSIVFRMENKNTGIPYSDSRNITSVAELEKETGFTYFPNLPEGVAATVKQNKATSPDWTTN